MVKSRSGSSDVMSSTYVPMIGCFVAGFVTNRFLNHQNVVTGELEEGIYSVQEIKEYWTKPGSGGFGYDIKNPILWGVIWLASLICLYSCIYYNKASWYALEIICMLMAVIAPSFLAWGLNNEGAWIIISVVANISFIIMFHRCLQRDINARAERALIFAGVMIFITPVLGSYSIYRSLDKNQNKIRPTPVGGHVALALVILFGWEFLQGLAVWKITES